MTITFPSENLSSLPIFVPNSITSIYPGKSPSNKTSRFPTVVLSVDPSVDTRFSPSYVPSVNTSRAPNEQQMGDLQEEIWRTLEQIKALEIL